MHPADNLSYEERIESDLEDDNNLAHVLLTNKLFCWSFPAIAYIFAVLLQTNLNDIVDIQYGASILYLSFGVRLFIALVFGISGLLWMILGQIFIFTFYPTPYYVNNPVESFVLTCIYSVIAYLVVELVRKSRKLDSDFNRVSTVDIILITILGSLVSSLAHFAILGSHFPSLQYGLLTSFASKFVGSMIGFYGLMLLFAGLHNIKTTPKV